MRRRAMKRSIGAGLIALGLLALGAEISTSAQMTPGDKSAIEKTLTANEQKINDAIVKGDAAAFKSLVAEDAVSVDDQGVSTAADMIKMLKPGNAKITDAKLDGFKVVWVDPNTAVVIYTWSGKGTFMGQPVHSPSYSSTVYTKRGTRWVPVFHQETYPSSSAAPAAKK
jgi:ketosteroid isomerase-like protein